MRQSLVPAVLLISFAKRSLAAVCDNNNCKNGAACQANLTVPGAYFCVCPEGYSGSKCEINNNDCAPMSDGTSPCQNNGTCTDAVNNFTCSCPHGFSGHRCETRDYWTMQQWLGAECDGLPWRCFRLQMDKCINTGFKDGNAPVTKYWYGRLRYDKTTTRYTADLCWGKKDDEEESCNCENHYTKIPRLGKNSLGPVSAPGVKDSSQCHKLMKITSSRLVSSTGENMDSDNEDEQNRDCGLPKGGATRLQGMVSMGVLTALLINAVRGLQH